jgi:cytochrome c oxidase subunit 4
MTPHAPTAGHPATQPHHGDGDEGHGGRGEPHLVPLTLYYTVFAWLMVLLIITLVAAYFNLGSLNLPIAMTIAVIKAALVLLFFMHLRWSTNLVKFISVSAFFWLSIMFFLTLSDYFSRGWLPQAGK